MIRRIAFFGGLILGSGLCAWVLASALIYFFTGKMPAIAIDRAKGIELKLLDLDAPYHVQAAAGKE